MGRWKRILNFFGGFLTLNTEMPGGLARVAAYAKSVRQEQVNVLYIDGGDTFHGTAPLVLSQGEVMPGLLNQMGLDALVPGNWDFAYGIPQLKRLTRELNFPALAANLYDSTTDMAILPPYTIKEFSGCTVALLGLTYPYIDKTMSPSFSEGQSSPWVSRSFPL